MARGDERAEWTSRGCWQLRADGGGGANVGVECNGCILHPLVVGDSRSRAAAYDGGVETAVERRRRRERRGGCIVHPSLLVVDHGGSVQRRQKTRRCGTADSGQREYNGGVERDEGSSFVLTFGRDTSHDRTARRVPHAKRAHPRHTDTGRADPWVGGYGCGSVGKYPWVTRAIPYCGGGGSGPLASFMSNPSLIRTFIRLPGR